MNNSSFFRLMSATGVLLALGESAFLIHVLELNWLALPVLLVTSSVAFILSGLLIKILTGKENHVMLRYFVIIITTNIAILHFLNLPVLTSLDILALGYGTIIFFGRFGCFSVGCCHGRPHRFGVSYSHDHVRHGFTSYYAGIRLFPIQIAEALGLLLIIAFSITEILFAAPHGTALSIFITLCGVLRFTLEYFRGDPGRPHLLSFSEAQWTILLLVIVLSSASQMAVLPVAQWQLILHGILVLAFFSTGIARFVQPQFRLNEPSHIGELMKFKLSELRQPVKVHTTSLGINISGCTANEETQYTLSSNKFRLDYSTVKQLKRILSIRHPQLSSEIHSQRPDVFSLIFRGKSE